MKALEYILVKILDIIFWFVDFFAEIFEKRPLQKIAYTIGYFLLNYAVFVYTVSNESVALSLFVPLLGFLWVYRD